MNNKVLKREITTGLCRPCRSRMNNLFAKESKKQVYLRAPSQMKVTALGKIQTVNANE